MKGYKKSILILCYIFSLVIGNIYVREEYNKTLNNISDFVVYGKESHEDLFNNTEGINSYSRALSFYVGEDNEIIYTPEIVTKSDGTKAYKDKIDNSKLNWNYFKQFDREIILTYNASICGVELNKDEVLIKLSKNSYDSSYLDKFRNGNIVFKYNDSFVSLKIKDIEEPDVYTHICISDVLYDEFVGEEKNYIFDLDINNYKIYERLKYDWQKLENNDFFGIFVPSTFSTIEISDKIHNLGNLKDFLNLLNIISGVIFVLLVFMNIVEFLKNYLNKE